MRSNGTPAPDPLGARDDLGDARGDRSDARHGAGAEPCLRGGGEMGAMLRAVDWTRTPLGPVERWPLSLKTMIGVVLGSRFPMLLWWGPELLHLYNDAYRPILRDKHPAALGSPASAVWAEIWSVVGPMVKGVQDGGPATWTEDLLLFINSGDMLEETYFTFSYSPVPGDDGGLGGVLNTVQETTPKVQSERQIRLLHELAARAAEARSEREAYRVITQVLQENELELPFALLYALDERGHTAQLVGACGWPGYEGPARPPQISLSPGEGDAPGWPLGEALRSGHDVLVEDLAARFGPLPAGSWNGVPAHALIFPLARAGSTTRAVLIAGLSPHRANDERNRRALRAIADQVTSALAVAHAYQTETLRAEALVELDRAKTQFFANVSHELRTPLTLMLGPVEDALATPQRSLAGASLELVQRNAQRLLRLVNTLLDFSRIESSRMRVAFEPCDLGALTADLASGFRSAVARAGLTFEVDCPPPRQPIYVDPELWEKIVLNLLSNALKFTFEGSIHVVLRDRDDHVELTVHDTGTGIPERELPRLFERFHRVHGARSRTHEGTGIGLAFTRDLVRLHGGTIEVTSKIGEGSTFTVAIPHGSAHLPPQSVRAERTAGAESRGARPFVEEALRWSGEEQAAASAPTAPAPAAPETSAPPSPAPVPAPHRARILVVDDNADLRTYLVGLLRGSYEVETAADGVAALEAIRQHKPTLVLSDVMMPRLDGFGLVRALRGDPTLRAIPVILLSARAGEESTIEGLESQADDYLVKPFSARELLARVHTHVELALQREVFERFFTLSLDIMCIAGTDGYFRRVSPALQALGYSHEELLSRPIIEFLHPDDVAPTLAEITRLASQIPSLAFENRYRRKDGVYRWISWTVAPDEHGVMYAIGRDVTEDKRTQAALRASQEAAELANRELEAFSYSVAHDLRAPLRSIDGFSLALLEDYAAVLDDEGRQHLSFVRESAQRMAVLIDDLLALSRVSRSELRREPMDLSALARNVAARLAQANPDRHVEVEIEEGLLDEGDDRLLGVVLENLIGNAWKFTARRAHARIELGTCQRDGHRAYFVRDNGAGFDMAFAHKLFGVFQRLHANTEFEGTGIGLATVQRVIRRHGGRVWAEGEVDRGATFYFTLHEKEEAV